MDYNIKDVEILSPTVVVNIENDIWCIGVEYSIKTLAYV